MIIQCSACQAKFKLAEDRLKPGGVKVKCTKCSHIFTVQPPEDEFGASASFSDLFSASAADLPAQTGEIPQGVADPAGKENGPERQDDDFGTFDMEGLDDPFAASTGEGLDLDAIDFSTPSSEASEEPIVADSAGAGEELPPVEDFDFSGEGFAGFDNESLDLGTQGAPENDVISFEEDPAIGGDLGVMFETENTDAELPSLNEQYLPSPEEFSFDNPSQPDTGTIGDPTEFSFEDPGPDAVASDREEIQLDQGIRSDEFVFDDPHAATEPADAPEKLSPPSAAEPISPPEDKAPKVIPHKPSQKKAKRPAPKTKRRKKKGGRGIWVLLFLILLLGAGYGYFGYSQGSWEPQVLLEKLQRLVVITSQPKQTGNIEIKDIQGQFVANQNAGQLFVVHGKIVNRYNGTRSSIAVKGIIYDSNGQAILQQTAFCGNFLDEAALRTLPYSKIDEAMNNPFGDSLSNVDLAPGQSLPFSIVFRDVPSQVSEFNVEVADSKPGAR